MTTLAPYTTPGTYEYQVLDLLHDPSANRWSTTQIDQYVNEARKQTCKDLGCLRSLQASYVTQNYEQYTFGQVTGAAILTAGSSYTAPTVSFSGGGGTGVAATLSVSGGAVNAINFTSFGSGYSSAPTALVTDTTGSGCTLDVGVINVYTYDVVSINLFWGNARYALKWYPFREFSAVFRPYSNPSYQRTPAAWCVYGQQSVFFGSVPDQTYAVEFDSIILPTPFATGDTTTIDPIPSLSQDPIKFYAAHLAKFNSQAYGEAEMWKKKYRDVMLEIAAVYTGRLPDIYQG